jgi:hypothetical protein
MPPSRPLNVCPSTQVSRAVSALAIGVICTLPTDGAHSVPIAVVQAGCLTTTSCWLCSSTRSSQTKPSCLGKVPTSTPGIQGRPAGGWASRGHGVQKLPQRRGATSARPPNRPLRMQRPRPKWGRGRLLTGTWLGGAGSTYANRLLMRRRPRSMASGASLQRSPAPCAGRHSCACAIL